MTDQTVVLFEHSEFTTVPTCPEIAAHEVDGKADKPGSQDITKWYTFSIGQTIDI